AGMLSSVVSQSYLLENEVYLTDFLANVNREEIGGLKCLVFVRPTAEYFADFYVLHENHASLQLGSVIGQQLNSWNRKLLCRSTEGLGALLLSLRKRPLIRYDRASLMATNLAHEIHDLMEKEEGLFDFRQSDSSPILLILDRRFDLITPLLLQWTYQAMVHEIFGISNGRVNLDVDALSGSLEDPPVNKSGTREHVICTGQDAFYRDNVDSTFGDLGENVRMLVQTFQERTLQHQSQLDSIPSMKRFIEDYPEYRRMSTYVSKHVALVGEISKRVEAFNLLQLSEIEQNIVTNTGNIQEVTFMLQREDIAHRLKVKLAIIYALCHSQSPAFDFLSFIDLLRNCEFSPDDISDNSNVYTRHVPPILDIVDSLVRGRLPLSNYPFLKSPSTDRPQEIIVFMVNGTTYEEASYLRKYCQLLPGVSVVLAGTTVHNSSSIMDELLQIRDEVL
ncbi:hypothetical protein PSACC_01597, partial [Paramicrosporidium saccamoebae]